MTPIDQDGWTVLPKAIAPDLVLSLAGDLERAYLAQRAMQIRNGVGDGTDGTVHHLPAMGGSFLDLLERDVADEVLAPFFGGPYVLNTFGGVLNAPGQHAYVARVHRDLRSFSGDFRLMAQTIVMLDDFTEDNGATYVLSGSHRRPQKPADEEFFRDAARVTGSAGDVVVFNSNLWHAAGANHTKRARRALTLAFTRPFVKPQFDYPRALGYERGAGLSDVLRQRLGYNARVPATLDEWYQPPERRMYKPGQG